MEQATTVQMEQMKKIDIDKIDDLKDKMEDMAYDQQEMNDLLNFNSFTYNVDESDLDAELNSLGFEMNMQQNLPNMNVQQPSQNQSLKQNVNQYMQ